MDSVVVEEVRSESKIEGSSLVEMIKADELLRDFFKFVHEENFRKEAHEAFEKKLKADN